MSQIATNFDHVNLNTKYLEETISFYTLLGLVDGPRPDFDFNGSWLYLDPDLQTACIHLVETLNQQHIEIIIYMRRQIMV